MKELTVRFAFCCNDASSCLRWFDACSRLSRCLLGKLRKFSFQTSSDILLRYMLYLSISARDIFCCCLPPLNPFLTDCAKPVVFDEDCWSRVFVLAVCFFAHWWSTGNRCFTQNACRQSWHCIGTRSFALHPRWWQILEGFSASTQLFCIWRLTYTQWPAHKLVTKQHHALVPSILIFYPYIWIFISRPRYWLFTNRACRHSITLLTSLRRKAYVCVTTYRTSRSGSFRLGHLWSSSLKCSWLAKHRLDLCRCLLNSQ